MTQEQLQSSLQLTLVYIRDQILEANQKQLAGVTITIRHDEIAPTMIARLRVQGYSVEIIKYKEKNEFDDIPARYTALITW